METSVTQIGTASQSAVTSTPSSSATTLSSDFETFIQMLTTQARYQDPLEPIDSSEYAAQLAQFSMVEQQVRTNDTLTELVEQMGTTTMASLADWVGMEARAAAPMHFSGDPITISPNPAAVSDSVFLSVTNENGQEVQRMEIPISAEPLQWTGQDENGDQFPNGLYRFTVESHSNGELILSETAEVYGRVTEAQGQGGNIVLILEGGSAILSTSVTALREPA